MSKERTSRNHEKESTQFLPAAGGTTNEFRMASDDGDRKEMRINATKKGEDKGTKGETQINRT